MRVPPELVGMVGVLLVLELGCTWTIRSDWRRPDGRMEWWGLSEAFVGLFLMLCMLVSSALQVLVRYLFSDDVDVPWTEEFGRLAMIWADAGESRRFQAELAAFADRVASLPETEPRIIRAAPSLQPVKSDTERVS